MHVSGTDPTQHAADPNSASSKSVPSKTESGSVFAAFLKNGQNQDVTLLRIAGSLGFAPALSDLPEPPPPALNNHTDTRDAVSLDSDNDDNIHADRSREDDAAEDDAAANDDSQPSAKNSASLESQDVGLSLLVAPATPVAILSNVPSSTAIASESAPGVAAPSRQSGNGTNLTPLGNQAATQAGATATPAEAAAKASNIAPPPKNQDSAGGQPSNVVVTEEKASLHSRPASTLASAATVAAQTTVASQVAKGTSLSTEPAATSGNLLLNAAANKESAQRQSGQQHTGQQSAKSAAPTPPATNPTAQPVPIAPTATAMTSAAQPAAGGATMVNGQGAARSAFGEALTSATGPVSAQSIVERPGQVFAKPPTPAATPPRPMTDQIAVQIRKAVDQGVDKIRIQLRPAELGRVDIKLDIGADGRVAVSVSAERPETVELLQRDVRGLQQALQDAGLRADSGSLSFNLSGRNGGENTPSSGTAAADDEAQSPDDAVVADSAGPRRASDSLIDVEV